VSSCVNFFVLILFGGRVGAFRDSVGLQEKKKAGQGSTGAGRSFVLNIHLKMAVLLCSSFFIRRGYSPKMAVFVLGVLNWVVS